MTEAAPEPDTSIALRLRPLVDALRLRLETAPPLKLSRSSATGRGI